MAFGQPSSSMTGTDSKWIMKDGHVQIPRGAEGIAIASPGRTAMLMEAELELASLIHLYSDFDLVLVEGYKMQPYPKLVLLRGTEDMGLLDQVKETRVSSCVLNAKGTVSPA